MSSTKRKRGGTPRAAAAASVSGAVLAAASASAAAPSAQDDETARGSFHAHAAAAAAAAAASPSAGNQDRGSALSFPYAPANQITPSPTRRAGLADRQLMRSDTSDDGSSTSSDDANANSGGASVSVERRHTNDDDKEASSKAGSRMMDVCRGESSTQRSDGDLFSSSSSSSEDGVLLDSDGDDSITQQVMQILAEEVQRGQESEDEMNPNAYELGDDTDDDYDAVDNNAHPPAAAAGRNNSPTFEVERILARRYNRQRKRVEYLLAWKDLADDPAESSWEPHEHLDLRAKDHVEDRWGESPIRPSDGMDWEMNDPALDGSRVAQCQQWEIQQLGLQRGCKPQRKKKTGLQQRTPRRKALPTNIVAGPSGSATLVDATPPSTEAAAGIIGTHEPLAPIPRPLVAEIDCIEILWKRNIPPFMLSADKWELVDDWSRITVYEWRGNEGTEGGLCCVGSHPYRYFPIRTAWRIVSRQGRKGRSKINRLTPDTSNDASTAASPRKTPPTASIRSEGAKRKRPSSGMPTVGAVKPGRSSASAPATAAGRGQRSPVNGDVRNTKAAVSFAANSKYVGHRVAKPFEGILHFGNVKKYLSSVARWAIHYDDGDTEDMNKKELKKAIEVYEERKDDDVESRSASEDADDGWNFGDDGELDLSQASHVPIDLPQVALEETIEFFWEKCKFPFEYKKNKAEVVDDWGDYQIYGWREGAGGGTAIVSYRSHPTVKVRVKWRPAKGRRRRKTNFLKPNDFSSSAAICTKKPSRAQAQARRHHGRAKKSTITMLELFSGSGVLSAAFRKKGVLCETLDDDPTWQPTYCMNIAQLRKHIEDSTVPEGLAQPRDIVFAAPCCTTFSRGSCGRHRNAMNIDGHSPEAQAANKMIDDLIFVLKYYKRLNNLCLFVIENPEGYLQMTPFAKVFEKEGEEELNLKMVTVSYCLLSEDTSKPLPRKHTCLWTNSQNIVHVARNDAYRCRDDCHVRAGNGRRHQKHVQDVDDRYASYPDVFNQFVRDHILADVRAQPHNDMSASSSSSTSSDDE
mmetsp:Transcript_22010/g.63109  ORF Transcript_22010/g.63109 Transcript_22010/m.63109 type:complete len:1032 (-) Transcript_22010:134-3229(-)|eukprot:CAMPEP_0181026474 /NCGR_PEP_ID=MMETSP1070-20121207/3660_1 /TAXON_ID=265543 /ORGANISM="Minutocellus polymorphus, Strain NH13" /LENGTH=1031 /DNA_ID=CAMNT_0023103671 /DNA_START=49 /DNA_END=3144 /DNA_ORIENTATION=-